MGGRMAAGFDIEEHLGRNIFGYLRFPFSYLHSIACMNVGPSYLNADSISFFVHPG